MTSGTLRDVGSVVVRFHHLLNDVETVGLTREDQHFVLEVRQMTTARSTRLTLLTLGSWVWYARWLTGRDDMRFHIDLMRRPLTIDQHWAFFGASCGSISRAMPCVAIAISESSPSRNRSLWSAASCSNRRRPSWIDCPVV